MGSHPDSGAESNPWLQPIAHILDTLAGLLRGEEGALPFLRPLGEQARLLLLHSSRRLRRRLGRLRRRRLIRRLRRRRLLLLLRHFLSELRRRRLLLRPLRLLRRLRRSLNRRVPDLSVPGSALRTLAGLAGRKLAADRLCGSLQIDSSYFRQTYHWTPAFSVDQGLAATVAWRFATR